MMAYKHILLATNFSQPSEKAGRKAVGLAGCSNARISLLHVIEYLPEEAVLMIPLENENKTPAQFAIEKTRKKLKQFSKRIGYEGAILLARLSVDHTNNEIIRVAHEIKSDLIVIAEHDETSLTELSDSTTKTVIDEAPCDVLIVHYCR